MSANRVAYLMARLTARGAQPDQVFGGKPALDKMDIAAACAKLRSLPFHFIMAKYCDDFQSALRAVGELQDVMCQKSPQWADMDPLKRAHAACALVAEFIGARKCPRCGGRGSVVENSSVVDCKPCDGTGFKAMSASARAKACGIPESTFRYQRLNDRFQDMIRYLNEAEINALESISRRVS